MMFCQLISSYICSWLYRDVHVIFTISSQQLWRISHTWCTNAVSRLDTRCGKDRGWTFISEKRILRQTLLGTQLPHQQVAWLCFPTWKMAQLSLTVESAAQSISIAEHHFDHCCHNISEFDCGFLQFYGFSGSGGNWNCSIRVFTLIILSAQSYEVILWGLFASFGEHLGIIGSSVANGCVEVGGWVREHWHLELCAIRQSTQQSRKDTIFGVVSANLRFTVAWHRWSLNHGLVRRSLIWSQMSYIFYSIPAAASRGLNFNSDEGRRVADTPKRRAFCRAGLILESIWSFVKVMLADVVIRNGLPTEWKDQAVCILYDASCSLQSPL